MANHSKERTKAEAQFKQAQKPQPAAQPTTEGGRAKADYVAAGHAERAKTARLKELRLAKKATGTRRKGCHDSRRPRICLSVTQGSPPAGALLCAPRRGPETQKSRRKTLRR